MRPTYGTKRLTARMGDSIDSLVYKEYGTTDDGFLEAVIKLNPHLVHKTRLSAGDEVNIPLDPPRKRTKAVMRLFGGTSRISDRD